MKTPAEIKEMKRAALVDAALEDRAFEFARGRMARAATLDTPVARVHGFAMAAKEFVFRAQDGLHDAHTSAPVLTRKLERILDKVRGELERLDREFLRSQGGG